VQALLSARKKLPKPRAHVRFMPGASLSSCRTQHIFNAQRPVILNRIDELATRRCRRSFDVFEKGEIPSLGADTRRLRTEATQRAAHGSTRP
jgi:hypothetical protein